MKLERDPITHPNYIRGMDDYDLCILILKNEVKNKFASYAKLPRPNEELKAVAVSGWGSEVPYTFHNETFPVPSDVLRTVDLTIFTKEVPYAACESLRCNGCHKFDYNVLLCGDNLEDKTRGPCKGDSGGRNNEIY